MSKTGFSQISKILILHIILIAISKCICKNEKESFKRNSEIRRSGILMHISSLPSKYGIGTLGIESYKFIDFLVKAKQKEWEILPIGPTGYRGSPYDSFSSYAGNPYFVDLDILVNEGLLEENEITCQQNWGLSQSYIDFTLLYVCRDKVLKKAFQRFKENEASINFYITQNYWLDDYSLFMALKKHFLEKSWIEWPKKIKDREKLSLIQYKKELKNEIEFNKFVQFKFYEQYTKLKEYANSKGIKIIGDLPFYVPLDSADVWSNPQLFQLDEDSNPIAISGAPPDYFNSEGQLWGTPLYNWERMEYDNYNWLIRRFKYLSEKADTIKIDHFRAFESYWSIPFGSKTPRNGKWIKGPGKKFIDVLHEKLPNVNFIAEDLGYINDEVIELREYSGYPGIKILQFAFNSKNNFPYDYPKNSVCYLGTHDNNLIKSWEMELSSEDRNYIEKYLNVPQGEELTEAMIKLGLNSASNLFIAQMQDYLKLSYGSRMNRPGTVDGNNWIWRILKNQLNDTLAEKIGELSIIYGRAKKEVKVPILVGDVGGTNSRLKLLIISSNIDDVPQVINSQKLHSFDFQNVEELLFTFLEPYKGTKNYPKYAVFGVPGPIKDNTVMKFTNVKHWDKVKGNDIAKKLNLDKVIFLNDFVANGYGIQTKLIKGQDYTIINDVPVDPNGVKITFGPGTGLGMGFLTKKPEEKYYLVNACEGGHYDFPARNKIQFQYLEFLSNYYNIDHVSVERATCGQSIIPIYKFLSEINNNIEKDDDLYKRVIEYKGTTNSIEQINLNNEIVKKGISKECKLCYETLNFFIELYGAAAGNAALVTLPNGGIYLLGGLSIALEKLILDSDIFMNAFIDKGRFKELLKNIPIFLIKTDDLGNKGCIEYARRLLEDSLDKEDIGE